MENTGIIVENIKCGGCAASITRRLKGIPGVIEVSVARSAAFPAGRLR